MNGKHKLMSCANGPFRVVGVSSDGHTVEIRREDHDERVNITRVEVAPRDYTENPSQDSALRNGNGDTAKGRRMGESDKEDVSKRSKNHDGNLVNRIVGHPSATGASAGSWEVRVK